MDKMRFKTVFQWLSGLPAFYPHSTTVTQAGMYTVPPGHKSLLPLRKRALSTGPGGSTNNNHISHFKIEIIILN